MALCAGQACKEKAPDLTTPARVLFLARTDPKRQPVIGTRKDLGTLRSPRASSMHLFRGFLSCMRPHCFRRHVTTEIIRHVCNLSVRKRPRNEWLFGDCPSWSVGVGKRSNALR